MTDIKCPYDSTQKSYIIPTGSWLKAIEKLSHTNISTNRQVIISKLLEKSDVLVKLTPGKSAKLRDINSKIKGLPNMVYTHCVIFCNDYLPVLLDKKEFCTIKDDNYKVTLEIMKFYNGGSINRLDKIKLKLCNQIITQLVLAQINLFVKTGLTHCDIHEGNILISKTSNEKELIYSYLPNPVTIKSKYEFILSDYDKCVDFSPNSVGSKYLTEIDGTILEFDMSDTIIDLELASLMTNIFATIRIISEKLNTDDKKIFSDKFNEFKNKFQNIVEIKEKKYIWNYVELLDKSENNRLEQFSKFKIRNAKLAQDYYDLLIDTLN